VEHDRKRTEFCEVVDILSGLMSEVTILFVFLVFFLIV
jgi:hypothetical protein